MRESLCNNSLFVCQLYEDKFLEMCACDLIFFTTDLKTVNYYTKFTARADLFLKSCVPAHIINVQDLASIYG